MKEREEKRYVAELSGVREVSLRGAAELTFWTERLLKEDLIPANQDGKAELLIVAADMRFMGVRFTEVSFSVRVSMAGQRGRGDAAFLGRAFNSCRLFALCERVFFGTPYYHGDCRVSHSSPISVRIIKSGGVAFQAGMGADSSSGAREPSCTREEKWEGAVFLPGSRRGGGGQGHVFFAKMEGLTRVYPFFPEEDSVSIRPSSRTWILQALLDSHFVGKEWSVREDATHAKSGTYKRPEAITG